ncbi:MAG: hypothetical protein HN368_01720 [Spirochaetales bacterium]|jgi:exonuclease III|nr:hypothetical protein [Spirochaetales bacterium]
MKKTVIAAALYLLIPLAPAFSESGSFSLLTYNVAGLPDGLSQSSPALYNKQISPLLNSFDVVVVQENFSYHKDLTGDLIHDYIEPKGRGGFLGDGLSRFSKTSFANVDHTPWTKCYGFFRNSNDCLTKKGYSVAVHEIAPGIYIDIYNLHMDAGSGEGDMAAKDAQIHQLIERINSTSPDSALIVAGDWNLSKSRSDMTDLLNRIAGKTGLIDACEFLKCGDDRIDRVMFRSGAGVELLPLSWKVERKLFVTESGKPLSDHDAVAVVFSYTVAR